jgi:CO/xanthine dehydrogenase FAD-binding subunit
VPDLTYLKPQSLRETLSLLAEYQGRARPLAGGTDLLVKLKKGRKVGPVLLQIADLAELNYLKLGPGGELLIGAASRLAQIEQSPLVRSRFSLLGESCALMASPTVRAMATVAGNLCNAAPSADLVPALIVLGAKARIESLRWQQSVPVEDLFLGPGKTVLQPGEMITEIEVPAPPGHSGASYLKQKRGAGADLAVAGAAARVVLSQSIIQDVRIALSAVAPTPLRARRAEELLRGKIPGADLLGEAGRIAVGECSPIDDARASADYRRKLVAALVPRTLQAAVERAQAGRPDEN